MATIVSWGVVNIEGEKLISAQFSPTANLIEIEKVTGYSTLQKANDPLLRPRLTVRLDYQYCNPLAIYNDLDSKMANLYSGLLLIGKRNLGYHLLADISVKMAEIDDAGNWLRCDLDLSFIFDRDG